MDTALTRPDRRACTAYIRTERQKDNRTVETAFTASSNSLTTRLAPYVR